MNWCWKFLSTQKSKFPRRKDLCRRLCWKLVCIGNSDYQSSYSMERKRKKLLQNRKKFLMDDNSQAKLNCIKCTYREASITFKIQIYSLPGSKNSKSLNVNYSLTKLIFVSVTGFFFLGIDINPRLWKIPDKSQASSSYKIWCKCLNVTIFHKFVRDNLQLSCVYLFRQESWTLSAIQQFLCYVNHEYVRKRLIKV